MFAHKFNRRRTLILVCAVVLSCLIFWPVKVLVLSCEKKGDILLRVNQGEKITLQYVHSIYHVDQREVYELNDSRFILQGMFFGDMQAALYYDSYARYTMRPTTDGYEVSGLNQPYPVIRFALGHGTSYQMTIGSRMRVDLNRTFHDATFLHVRTEDIPMAEYYFRRLTNGREVR